MSVTAERPRVVLGVGGGIAAYKACILLRRFTESGHEVTVVPTDAALEFVGAATWAALSGHPVSTGVFDRADEVPHVRLGRAAELVVVAPATADLLARAASGRADDLLTNVLLTTRAPVLFCPAMHTEMWTHPATRANVATLRDRGAVVLDPADGRLTGADTGPGRLPEPDDLFAVAATLTDPAITRSAAARDLAGLRVLVSAGGTREHLDPVRFLANASSGRMGLAVARAAALRGAEVEVVAANITEPIPSGCTLTRVGSTAQLGAAMTERAAEADVVVMAAAPADYTPAQVSSGKIKKRGSDGLTLDLVQTTDILAALVAARERGDGPAGQVIVGFAAETPTADASLEDLGRAKLARKGCDLLALNDVSDGAVFGSDDTVVSILGADGLAGPYGATKARVAHRIVDAALAVHAGR